MKAVAMTEAFQPRIPLKILSGLGGLFLFLFALALRAAFWDHHSADFDGFVIKWYLYLQEHGFKGLATVPSDYSPPYLTLLYLATALDLPALETTKTISCLFDFAVGFGVYQIVATSTGKTDHAALAGTLTLFLPTVFLNSAMWAQCDSIYGGFLILSMAQFLRRNDWAGWIFWGLAFVFKLQAVLFLPAFMYLWLSDRSRRFWAPLAVIPLYIASLAPAFAAGKSVEDLLGIYTNQVTQYYNILSYNAPTWLQWIPNSLYTPFVWASTALTGGAVILSILGVWTKRRVLSDSDFLSFATFLFFLVPFLLPKMHERYFYPAETLAVALAFARPRLAGIAIAAQIVGLFVYEPYLMGTWPPIAMNVLPLAVLGILLLLGKDVYSRPAAQSF